MLNLFLQPLNKLTPSQKDKMAIYAYLLAMLFFMLSAVGSAFTFLDILLGVFSFFMYLFLQSNAVSQRIKQGEKQSPAIGYLVTAVCMFLIFFALAAFDSIAIVPFFMSCFLMVNWIVRFVLSRVTHPSAIASPAASGAIKPDLPKTSQIAENGCLSPDLKKLHPIYQEDLKILRRHLEDLQARKAGVSSFLDSFFAGSAISKTRYTSVLQNAEHVLEANYNAAAKAAMMFGNSIPTPEREQLMDRYVNDSTDVMNKIDGVINQLLKVQQSDVLSEGDTLDVLLDDLAATTSYYQRSQRS